MHVHKATFWPTLIAVTLIGLTLILLCGCTTIGTCERLAIAEEMHHYKQGNPVFRVHYWWWSYDEARFKGHARNYLLHPDGTRSYYDVGGVYWVPKPAAYNIGYDSYDVRVINGVTNPPTAAPRRGDGGPPEPKGARE